MSACIVRLWLVARVRRLALLLAVGGAAALVVSSAAAAQPGARIATVSLHPRFQRVPGDRLVASDRYVVISSNQVAGAAPVGNGVLIDGLTRRRTTVLSPDCVSSALGGPWLALTCNPGTTQTFELYNIPTKRFQPLTTAPALAYHKCAVDCVPIAAVGADWVAFEAPPGDPEHGVPAFEFQNIQTGEAVSQDPTSSTATVDLNSPQLRQGVCSPLRVPAVSTAYASGWGSLTFTDGLALAAGDSGSRFRSPPRLTRKAPRAGSPTATPTNWR
jgi:hypothetical protein